jgi:exodeoxyribonuclease V alpha subunit
VEAGAVLGDLCHDAQAGNYDEATVDYVRAASGEEIPPASCTPAARWPSRP